MPRYNIDITVTARDLASASLGRVSGSLGRMSEIAGGMILAQGITRLAGGLVGLGRDAINSSSMLQTMTMSLETLIAREKVAAGEFETVTDAIKGVNKEAVEMLGNIRAVSLTSPFEYTTVASTFKMQMAFGNTAKQSIALTQGLLDTAAALGLTDEATSRLAYNFAQIHSIGKITGIDLRQLRMVGLDLATVMKDELGLSIDEVNAKLETGQLTMEQVSNAFLHYAKVNFGGAAERLSRSFQGLQSSFKDLMFFSGSDMMTPTLEHATVFLNRIFDTVRKLIEEGWFKKLGTQLGENFERILLSLEKLSGGKDINGVIKDLSQGLVDLTSSAADLVEWFTELDPKTRSTYIHFAELALIAGPAFKAMSIGTSVVGGLVGWFSRLMPFLMGAPHFISNVGLALQLLGAGVPALQVAGMGAAGFTAVLGPLAIAAGAAAAALYAYKKATDAVEAGTEQVESSWDSFTTATAQGSKNAVEAAEEYARALGDVNAVLEESKALLAITNLLMPGKYNQLMDAAKGDLGEVSQMIYRASQSWDDYAAGLALVAQTQGAMINSSGDLVKVMTDDMGNSYEQVIEKNFALTEAQYDWLQSEKAAQAARQAGRQELVELAGAAEDAGAALDGLVPEQMLPGALGLDTVLGSVKNTLGELGWTTTMTDQLMTHFSLTTGQVTQDQLDMEEKVRFVTAAYDAGLLSLDRYTDYMLQAADGSLVLDQNWVSLTGSALEHMAAVNNAAAALENLTVKQLGLSASLKDATDAQIAQTAIQELTTLYQEGEIHWGTYAQAVSGVQEAFGLSDEKSRALAEGLTGLTQALTDGELPAANFAAALGGMIEQASSEGAVDMHALLDKFGNPAIPEQITAGAEALKVWDENLGTWTETATTAVETVTSSFQETDWNAIGAGVDTGIIAGIDAGVPGIEAAAAAAARAAYAAAAAELQIESPSKKGGYLGKMFMVGQAGGIEDWQGLVERASSNAASATLGAASSAAGSSMSSTYQTNDHSRTVIHQHNHSAAAAAIANAQVDRMRRQRLNSYMGVS